jgi:predicted SprT family Zn-dependent metalloprotease
MTIDSAEKMAVGLIKYHGLTDYKFSFMKRRRYFNRAGQCWWQKKLIQLQPTFVELNAPVIVKQTLLHEIAHALRPRHHHNKFWKETARSIGCVVGQYGLRCYGKEVKRHKRAESYAHHTP